MKHLIIPFFVLLFASCDIRHPEFEYFIANHSQDTIFYYTSTNGEYLPSQQPHWMWERYEEYGLLPPGAVEKHQVYVNLNLDETPLSVVFLKKETIKNLTWPVLIETDTMDCVKFVSMKELKAANYMISYE